MRWINQVFNIQNGDYYSFSIYLTSQFERYDT